ncbi:hypothetical protein D3C76_1301870 [compost metagenome]
MSAGSKSYMKTVADPADPANMLPAFTQGVQNAFIFGMSMAIVGLILAFFVKRVVVNHKMNTPMH